MRRIGLISDTHGYFDENIVLHFRDCDEVWHGGDVGSSDWIYQLRSGFERAGVNPLLRGVYGNIDGMDIRAEFPECLVFDCEAVRVMILHIGGYPGKYVPGVKDRIKKEGVNLYISGHSHILKVMYDDKLQCLHMNPGAAGKQGWHQIRTLIRFTIDKKDIKDCEVIELGKK